MSEFYSITKFELVSAEKYFDQYSDTYYMAINWRGEYRGEGFITSTRCSPELWADESESITQGARADAGIFVSEEEKYGYLETDKETD